MPTARKTSLTLSPEAEKTIRATANEKGISMGEVVRRALAVDKFIADQQAQGNTIIVETPDKKRSVMVKL